MRSQAGKAFLFITLLIGSAIAQAQSSRTVPRTELYNYFFKITDNQECESHIPCRMLRRHLTRDKKDCEIDPVQVEQIDRNFSNSYNQQLRVKGQIRYLGFFPGSYGYNAFIDQGEVVINAKMYFSNYKDFPLEAIEEMRNKFSIASKIWNDKNDYPFPVRFQFELVENASEAHLQARLLKKYTRGPYFSKWSLSWSPNTIAHEFGHVLGMDDEYENNPFGGDVSKCSKDSIMCSSWNGEPQNYHYYLVFRRLLCS